MALRVSAANVNLVKGVVVINPRVILFKQLPRSTIENFNLTALRHILWTDDFPLRLAVHGRHRESACRFKAMKAVVKNEVVHPRILRKRRGWP